MRRLGALLSLLGLALLGAWLWRVLAADPGHVLITLRGWNVETTVVAALAMLLLGWAVLWLALLALRFPWRWWHWQRRRKARQCLAEGLVALHEGRWQRAEKLLRRAASDPQQRLPALLNAARAAQARGDQERAGHTLQEAAEQADPLTLALLIARQHQRQGRAEAITALFDAHPVTALPPRALALYLDALVRTGRAEEARALLPALRDSHVLSAEQLQHEEVRTVAAALNQSPDVQTLEKRWNSLSRTQRNSSEIVAAYARQSLRHGQAEAALTALDKALRRAWSPCLVEVYGLLPHSQSHSLLKQAEAWLLQHPQDPVLLLTLGRLCRTEGLSGKAEDYLRQALAQGAGAEAWEELGHVHAQAHEETRACAAFAQALASLRGATEHCAAPIPEPGLRQRIACEVEQGAFETRSSMGLPQLQQQNEPQT